jgi:hypothetical protein
MSFSESVDSTRIERRFRKPEMLDAKALARPFRYKLSRG